MESSVIQKLENLLLVSVPRDLLDTDVIQLRREILQRLRQHGSRWVLLDFSSVDICDSFFGRFIQSTVEMVGLMGAEVIVSGLQDAVVETMVDLGMVLANVRAVLDLDDALELSRSEMQKADDMQSAGGFAAEQLGSSTGQVVDWSVADWDDDPYIDLSSVDLSGV